MKDCFEVLKYLWVTLGPVSMVVVLLLLVIWWLERQGHRQYTAWEIDRDTWRTTRDSIEQQHRTDRDEWIEKTQDYAEQMVDVVKSNTIVITELTVIIRERLK